MLNEQDNRKEKEQKEGKTMDYTEHESVCLVCGGVAIMKRYVCGSSKCDCLKCGASRETLVERDEDNEIILHYEVRGDEVTPYVSYQVKEKTGFGVLKIDSKYIPLKTKEQARCFWRRQKQYYHEKLNLDNCYLYLYDNQKHTGQVVWGKDAPKDYDFLKDEDLHLEELPF